MPSSSCWMALNLLSKVRLRDSLAGEGALESFRCRPPGGSSPPSFPAPLCGRPRPSCPRLRHFPVHRLSLNTALLLPVVAVLVNQGTELQNSDPRFCVSQSQFYEAIMLTHLLITLLSLLHCHHRRMCRCSSDSPLFRFPYQLTWDTHPPSLLQRGGIKMQPRPAESLFHPETRDTAGWGVPASGAPSWLSLLLEHFPRIPPWVAIEQSPLCVLCTS